MKKMLKKIKEFFSKSNRFKHLLGGVAVGLIIMSGFDAILGATAVAMAMEYKDKAYGGKWDWIDIACTCVGGIIGSIVRQFVNLNIGGSVLWI